ncbi:hypothetical protein NQ317_007855 [Molorchus minor]|uniref:RING-type domain-containing protein n=1 Tax=Molorchus minor TaxID=1323400 RepID=A0ABQ9J316_9CUCU|nr:hypothetical protein NQ317_007855 [Molorchus minor]
MWSVGETSGFSSRPDQMNTKGAVETSKSGLLVRRSSIAFVYERKFEVASEVVIYGPTLSSHQIIKKLILKLNCSIDWLRYYDIDLAAIRRLLDSETSASTTCPSCDMPFDKGKKRRLIDNCGHERCYSCMFSSEVCPICTSNGTAQNVAHVYARPHHMLQTEEEVLDIVEDDPSTSTREIARQVNVSQHKVWKTVRENQLYPFHNNLTPGPDYTIFKCRIRAIPTLKIYYFVASELEVDILFDLNLDGLLDYQTLIAIYS